MTHATILLIAILLFGAGFAVRDFSPMAAPYLASLGLSLAVWVAAGIAISIERRTRG